MSNSRRNNATNADIRNQKVIASGTFKNVYAGTYTGGKRAGQKCVAKEFKTGSVHESHYFDEEMNVLCRAQMIIDDWHEAGLIDKRILLNTPEIWQYEITGIKCLVEPMIEKYEKFNSNTGWANVKSGAWGQAMQSLSHFSYHNSGGHFLLCDLQGGASLAASSRTLPSCRSLRRTALPIWDPTASVRSSSGTSVGRSVKRSGRGPGAKTRQSFQ